MSYPRSLLAVAALAACASSQKRNPFIVPKETFSGSLRIVAVAPVRLPGDVEDPEPLRARYAALLADRLRGAGLTVVPPEQVGPIVEERTREAGGLFDPVTGKVDESRARTLRAAIGRDLKERFGADAWIDPQVRVVHAPVSHDQAQWDGVSDAVNQGFFQKLLLTHSGAMPALSLAVWLVDAQGAQLYANAGGIHVLSHITLGGSPVRRTRAELFEDEARNADAVRIALAPLLDGRAR
jgi:hypothetical protein